MRPFDKSGTITCFAEMNAVLFRIVWMNTWINAIDLFFNRFSISGINQSDTAPTIARSAKSGAVYSFTFFQYFIDGNQLRTTGFILIDGAFPGLKHQLTESDDIPFRPSIDALLYPVLFTIIVIEPT